jgi:hypothetical protein
MIKLNLSNSSSSNFIRFMPSTNAWTNKDKEEITLKSFVFDINNIKTGWLHLDTGVRDWQEDQQVGQKGPQPSASHERAFIATFYNKTMGTVEWSSNSTGSRIGFEDLYKQCSDQYAANEGKLPVLNYVKSEAKKIGQGNTRIPRFEIVSWIAQPAGMYQSDAEFTAQVAAPPAPATKPVAAPAPAPAKSAMAQAVEDDEMF